MPSLYERHSRFSHVRIMPPSSCSHRGIISGFGTYIDPDPYSCLGSLEYLRGCAGCSCSTHYTRRWISNLPSLALITPLPPLESLTLPVFFDICHFCNTSHVSARCSKYTQIESHGSRTDGSCIRVTGLNIYAGCTNGFSGKCVAITAKCTD